MGIVAFLIGIRGKIRRSFSHRGVIGTLLYIPEFSIYLIKNLNPQRRKDNADELRIQKKFDLDFNVDTAGIVQLADMEVAGPNHDHGHYYLGTNPKTFENAMRQLPIEHEKFTFIDYGSGKGKALLLASLWDFLAVVGVEFSKLLHESALQNCKKFRHAGQKCRDITSIHMDATQYDLPMTPLVIYFYNPFSETVMSAVLKKIQTSLLAQPREIWIFYSHLYAHAPLNEASFLKLVIAEKDYRIYRNVAAEFS